MGFYLFMAPQAFGKRGFSTYVALVKKYCTTEHSYQNSSLYLAPDSPAVFKAAEKHHVFFFECTNGSFQKKNQINFRSQLQNCTRNTRAHTTYGTCTETCV